MKHVSHVMVSSISVLCQRPVPIQSTTMSCVLICWLVYSKIRFLHTICYFNSSRYILNRYFFQDHLLDRKHLSGIVDLWFQHERTPVHYNFSLRYCMDMKYRGRMMGKESSVVWQTRLPNWIICTLIYKIKFKPLVISSTSHFRKLLRSSFACCLHYVDTTKFYCVQVVSLWRTHACLVILRSQCEQLLIRKH